MSRLQIGAGLATVILVILLTLWIVVAPGWAIAAIEDRAAVDLDRALTVTGGAHLEFEPRLAIRLDGVSLAGPQGADGPFLAASSLHVPATLGGLLSRNLDFGQAYLTDPEIELTIDEMGRTSWPGDAAAKHEGLKLYLENARVHVADRRSGQSFILSQGQLAFELSATGEMQVTGSAAINGQFANLQAYVKDLSRVTGSGSPAEFSLRALPLSASFNGRLLTAGAIGLAGTVTLEGHDLREALKWTGSAPGGSLGLKAFNLSGALDSTARAFAVHGATLNLDGIAAKGELSFDFRGAQAKIQAILESEAINFGNYIPATGWTNRDWGTTPLGLSALRGIDVNATVTAANLRYEGYETGPARIGVTLKQGRLDAKIAGTSLAEADITLDGSGSVPGLALSLDCGDPQRFLTTFGHFPWLQGQGRLIASLQATGETQQEMVSNLKGGAQIALANGKVSGLDIPKTLTSVANAIQSGWPLSGGETPFTSLAASFAIADGIATMKPFKLDSASLSMQASGDIDLLRRALDLRADPRQITGQAGEQAGLPVAVVIKGPWDKPRLYPDMAGILENPKAAYEKLKALGLPQTPTGN